MAIAIHLPFRELEALSRSRLTVFLTFLHSRIAGQETGFLQDGPELHAEVDQRSRDAVLDGARLAVHSATFNVDNEIEFVRAVRRLKRLFEDHPVGFIKKILLKALVVDGDVSSARPKKYTSR